MLKSGNLIQGKCVTEFEDALQSYLNVKNVVVVSSGTAALHLSLLALGIAKGDEVIVPAFTFPAAANVIELLGAKPVLVDISLDDFCIDASRIEEAVSNRTKAILPVHEFGQAAEMDKVTAIAEKYDLEVVEDAACALGTEFNSRKAGTFGTLGCLSFHPRKVITTGEGGAVVAEDDELAERIRTLRNHGISIIDGKYDVAYAGLNYRITDFQAALGLFQLFSIEDIIKARIEIAKTYDEKLSPIDWVTVPKLFRDRKNVYQTYHIMLDDKIDRDELIRSLRKKDIEANVGAQALNCLTHYREKYALEEQDFPNAARAFKQGLALPMGNHVSCEDIEYIANTLSGISDKS